MIDLITLNNGDLFNKPHYFIYINLNLNLTRPFRERRFTILKSYKSKIIQDGIHTKLRLKLKKFAWRKKHYLDVYFNYGHGITINDGIKINDNIIQLKDSDINFYVIAFIARTKGAALRYLKEIFQKRYYKIHNRIVNDEKKVKSIQTSFLMNYQYARYLIKNNIPINEIMY